MQNVYYPYIQGYPLMTPNFFICMFFYFEKRASFLGNPVYDPIKQGIYNTLDSREFLIVENLRLIAHCTNHSCFGPIFKPFPDVLSLLEKLYFR